MVDRRGFISLLLASPFSSLISIENYLTLKEIDRLNQEALLHTRYFKKEFMV
jgi:hypothetical protein